MSFMEKKIQNRVTIKDIAKVLNIHNSTVSRALQGHPDVNPTTRNNVLATAKKMNYFPNVSAKRLKTKKTNTIGVIVPDLSKPFFATIVHSIIKAANKENYKTIITVSLEDPELEKENIRTLITERVEGMLVCTTLNTIDTEIFELVRKNNIPLVFYDRAPVLNVFSCVIIDNYNVIYKVIDFLINQGYKKIAIFIGSSLIPMGQQRIQGYKDALKKHNISLNKNWIIEGCNQKIDGYKNFINLSKKNKLPEVIFTSNSIIAQGIYEAAKEEEKNIPQDIGVVGFGPDKELPNLLSPKLTYIRTFPTEIGAKSCELLFQKINNKNRNKSIHVPVKFELNNSCKIRNEVINKTNESDYLIL